MTKNTLNKIGEIGLLNLIEKWVDLPYLSHSPFLSEFESKLKVRLGIGDDCASLSIDDHNQLLISVDLLIEDIHFRNAYFTPYQLGYRALAVNISDIAAMGGIPTQAVIGLAIPGEISIEFLEQFYSGMISMAKDYNIKIIGGDTVGSPGPFMISITILGIVENENLITRRGARPGDKIMVTGNLGTAMLGLEILEAGKGAFIPEKEALDEGRIADEQKKPRLTGKVKKQKKIGKKKWEKIYSSFLCPIPRIKEARILAKNHFATSMIDLSDGLSRDIHNICRSSCVGARINKGYIPVAGEVKALLKEWGKDPYHYALSGGEDYELLFTVKHEDVDKVKYLIPYKTGVNVSEIGDILDKEEGIFTIEEDGSTKTLNQIGFEHFSKWKDLI